MIEDTINRLIHNQQENLNKLLALQSALCFFNRVFGELNLTHQDVRGNDTTPSIIMATDSEFIIPCNIISTFQTSEDYELYKKYLISFGTIKLDEIRYFYIRSNVDLLGEETEEIIETMFNRCNNELFPHIENYFISK